MSYKSVSKILKDNEQWIEEQLKFNPDYLSKLSRWWKPKYLSFSCSDSRISAEGIIDVQPGCVQVA